MNAQVRVCCPLPATTFLRKVAILKMFFPHLLVVLPLGFLLTGTPMQAQSLEAGVARVDITPPRGLALQGYPGAGRLATDVRDPLFARVLVLRSSSTRVALVDLDLIAVFEPAYLTQLREAAKD